MTLEPVLTPHGLLTLRETGEALALEPGRACGWRRRLHEAPVTDCCGSAPSEVGTALPPVLSYWRELGVRYVTALCALPGIGEGKVKPPVPIPGDSEFDTDGGGRSADDRRGIPDGRLSWPIYGEIWMRPLMPSWLQAKALGAGVPQKPSSGLESGWARAFQPRRESEGRGSPVCVSCDLHDPTFGCRPRPSICRSARPCRSIPVRGTANACCRC